MPVTISFTIQDNSKAAEIGDSFDAELPGRTEAGLTKTEWVKQKLIDYARQVHRNYKANQAAGAARATVESDVNSITIT